MTECAGDPTCRVCNAPTGDDTWLCISDTGTLEINLGELPALLAELEVNRAKQSRGTDGGRTHRAKPGSKLPIDLGASDLQRDIEQTLTWWARHLAHARGVEVVIPSRLLPEATAAARMAAWLLTNVASVRLDEACADLWHDVERLHHRITRTIDRPAERLYSGPCRADVLRGEGDTARVEKCPADLYAVPGADRIVCDGWTPSIKDEGQQRVPGCGATHTAQDRHGFQLDAIEDALVPLDLLRLVVPKLTQHEQPDRRTVWSWVSRKRLIGHGVDRFGNELFRGGDFTELVSRLPRTVRVESLGRTS